MWLQGGGIFFLSYTCVVNNSLTIPTQIIWRLYDTFSAESLSMWFYCVFFIKGKIVYCVSHINWKNKNQHNTKNSYKNNTNIMAIPDTLWPYFRKTIYMNKLLDTVLTLLNAVATITLVLTATNQTWYHAENNFSFTFMINRGHP